MHKIIEFDIVKDEPNRSQNPRLDYCPICNNDAIVWYDALPFIRVCANNHHWFWRGDRLMVIKFNETD